jgi:hypothetical protein
VSLFQGDPLLVAHQPGEEVGAVGTAGEELGVRAAVGHARDRVRRAHHLGHKLGVRALVGAEELDVEVAGQRQVEHRLDRMLALCLGDLPDAAPDVLLQVLLAVDALDHELGRVAADAGLDRPQPLVGLLGLVDESLAQLGVLHLLDLLLLGPRGHRAPRRRGVVEVPVLEREREPGAHRGALGEDRQPLRPALLDPRQWATVDVGVGAGDGDDVVEDRPLGDLGELLEEGVVPLEVPFRLGDLDRALVTLAQHLAEGEDVLVDHRVGDHRRAVEVGLYRVGAEALDREPGEPGVHPLVQQPLHLLALLARGGARLGRLEPHHVRHQRRRRHVLDDVHALRRAVQRIEVLGDRLPVPRHALAHRLVGDRLGARHRQHRAVTEVRRAGGEAEPTVAEHHRRHAVPAGDRAPRVPADLGVVVGVAVDEAGRHDLAGGVDHPVGDALRPPADLGDAAVLDPHVTLAPRHPGAVDDGPTRDVDVVVTHAALPSRDP